MSAQDRRTDPSDPSTLFSDDTERARERFLAACGRLGVRVRSYPGEREEATGISLYADIARLGAPSAKRAVLICSGAAGTAGLAASGIILGCLERGIVRAIPRDVALVLVHAVNPVGPAWPATVIDTTPDVEAPAVEAKPPSEGWDNEALNAAERRFSAYQSSQGFDRNRLANLTLSSMAPAAWSNNTAKAIVDTQLQATERLCILDLRTGPGRYGEMELFPAVTTTGADWARAATWLRQDSTSFKKGRAIGGTPVGCGFDRYARGKSAAVAIPIAVEFGTYSAQYLLDAIANPDDRASGYPTDPAWRTTVWKTARDLVERTLGGIAGLPASPVV